MALIAGLGEASGLAEREHAPLLLHMLTLKLRLLTRMQERFKHRVRKSNFLACFLTATLCPFPLLILPPVLVLVLQFHEYYYYHYCCYYCCYYHNSNNNNNNHECDIIKHATFISSRILFASMGPRELAQSPT